MANVTSQGIYSPLPQSLSDSESEKETPETRPKFCERRAQNGVHDNGVYNGYVHPLEMTKLPEIKKVQPAMSLKRKLCFITSIGVCFLTIVVFLWVLPCSDSGTCPIRISNWENQHDGIELTGKINVVKSAFKNTLNLALFFKRNLNSADSQNGAISVLGSNGAIAWYIPQVRTPTDLNCYLVDVNDDDINDCLLLGEMGLQAIDPVSGTIFWHAHNHSQSKVMTNLDFPIVLQDLNYDNVNEILTVRNFDVKESKFVIISGKTGMLMGEVGVRCAGEVHVTESNATSIIYQCKSGNDTSYYHISLTELISKVFNRSEELGLAKVKYSSAPHYGYVLNGRRLVVKNTGTCPKNCRVDITLMEVKTDRNIISWSYQNSYALTPATFSFKPTKENLSSLKGHINGFILKLWQWFDYGKKEKRDSPGVVKRYVPVTSNVTTRVNLIMERVVLVTFNDTNFHVINASLTEITQLCFPGDDGGKMTCQPGLENQNSSLLITDLDMDGSQELVSYSSTFVKREEYDRESWQLVSNMKVIRLEAELPKLYEVAK